MEALYFLFAHLFYYCFALFVQARTSGQVHMPYGYDILNLVVSEANQVLQTSHIKIAYCSLGWGWLPHTTWLADF